MNAITVIMVSAALTATVAVGQVEEGRRDGPWRAQVGWVHQWNRRMTVSGTDPTVPVTEVGGRQLRREMPGRTYPDSRAFIPRTFDNGYVHPDHWTGDAALLEGPNPERYGTTWNWGVDDPGQYNYDGGNHPTLTFRLDRGDAVLEGAPSVTGDSGSQKGDMPVDGIELKLNRLLHAWVKQGDGARARAEETLLNMDMVFRLAWFPKHRQRFQRSADQRVLAVSETYVYHDYYGGQGAAPLELPYSGSVGTTTDAGPLIPATPQSVRQVVRFMGTVRNNIAIKSEVWRLRGAAGLEFVKPLTERLSLFVSPQFILEVVRMDVVRTENVTFTSGASGATDSVDARVDRNSKTQIVPGALLSVGVDYAITDNWFLSVGYGYEWLTKDPSVRVGDSRVDFDLDGGEFTLAVGRWF